MNDEAALKKVAARLARDPACSVRSAIAQSLDKPTDTNIRRLQRKWGQVGESLLMQARAGLHQEEQERIEQRHLIEREIVGDSLRSVFGGISDPFFPSLAVERLNKELAKQRALEEATRPVLNGLMFDLAEETRRLALRSFENMETAEQRAGKELRAFIEREERERCAFDTFGIGALRRR